ncbi:MAG: polysaccharide deacetylase family protein [Flavobacteriales bacterium]|nr:polysaccharide deacetylase family protein [Flavobacteriales bacterium]
MTGQKVVLPFYHIVSDETPNHIYHLYEARSIEEFKSDLEFLLKNYQPISLQELIELNKTGRQPKQNVFHLTFDDGLKEFYTVVAPILKEKKIPATVFINTDFIDNEDLFYRYKASVLTEKYAAKGLLEVNSENLNLIDEFAEIMNYDFYEYLNEEQPYLTFHQIQELIKDGFTIGAHSKNHPLYNRLSIDEQISQTLESIDFIVQKFNLNYKVFSFPFTDDGISKDFFSKIESKVDLTFGTAGLKKDSIPFNLQRIPMEKNQTAKEIIKGQYFYYLLKRCFGQNEIKRK